MILKSSVFTFTILFVLKVGLDKGKSSSLMKIWFHPDYETDGVTGNLYQRHTLIEDFWVILSWKVSRQLGLKYSSFYYQSNCALRII